MKNILLIGYYLPPASGVGTIRITKFAKYLKQLNYNPVVVTVSDKNYKNKDNSLLNDLKGIKVYRLDICNYYKREGKNFYYSLKLKIDDIVKKEKIDFSFITGGPFEYLKIGIYLKKKLNINYIIDLRDPWSLQKTIDGNFIKKFKNRIYKYICYLNEKKIFKYSTYITTVNETLSNDYKRKFKNIKNKFYTIPNAIDFDDYLNVKAKQFKKKTIIYSGKFSTSSGFRNPCNLFKAIDELNKEGEKIEFIHVGDIDKKVKDIVEENNYSFVRFLGYCDYNNTISLCKGADLLVIISTDEPCEQTGKIYDYLGVEKPILAISNNYNEISKICEKYSIKIVDKDDVTGIKNSISLLLNSDFKKYNVKSLITRKDSTIMLIKLIERM